MTRLIAKIDSQINLDNIRYSPNFNYKESPYASMDFPEVGNIDLYNIVGSPPKNSSSTTRSELKYLQNITTNRTKAEIDLIYKVDDDPILLFEDIISKHDLDFPKQFFVAVYYTCAIAIVDHLKYFYNRPRPFQLAEYYDLSINRIVTKTHKTPAYPSGHTMYAALIAEILSDKYPKYKTEFDKLVDLCGKGRELQGVHYPSDNVAAKKIIKTIYPELKKYYIGVGHEL
tara:strand:- start:235 stop:921 length:687 start_codon:yes stop_codon:yes gene_type:complete